MASGKENLICNFVDWRILICIESGMFDGLQVILRLVA